MECSELAGDREALQLQVRLQPCPKAWLCLATLSLLPLCATRAQDLKAGQLLIATQKSRDPEFSRRVVLLIHCDGRGAAGLIINRPSDVTLARVFPELQGAETGHDPVYLGGPIGAGARALLRSRTKPEKAERLFADVYTIPGHHLLEKLAAEGKRSNIFRVYVGYTGWSLQQLKSEVSRGLWDVRSGDARAVFDPRPGTLWTRLNQAYRPPL